MELKVTGQSPVFSLVCEVLKLQRYSIKFAVNTEPLLTNVIVHEGNIYVANVISHQGYNWPSYKNV